MGVPRQLAECPAVDDHGVQTLLVVRQLPERQAQVLVLYSLEFTDSGIGELLGLAPATVRSHRRHLVNYVTQRARTRRGRHRAEADRHDIKERQHPAGLVTPRSRGARRRRGWGVRRADGAPAIEGGGLLLGAGPLLSGPGCAAGAVRALGRAGRAMVHGHPPGPRRRAGGRGGLRPGGVQRDPEQLGLPAGGEGLVEVQ